MLRNVLLFLSLGLLLAGLAATLSGSLGASPLLVWGAILSAAVLYNPRTGERRYEPASGPEPTPGS